MQVRDIVRYLKAFAPLDLAEDWDNIGLLVGSEDDPAAAVMTCLTLTNDVAEEAIAKGAQLIVTHHPVLFRAVKRLTRETPEGRLLLDLIRAGISVYSPHTSYDSAQHGINRQLAQMLGLRGVQALRPSPQRDRDDSMPTTATSVEGGGRFGDLSRAMTLAEFVEAAKRQLGIKSLNFVGDLDREVCRIAVACGAAAEFLPDAIREGCDVLLTGEARFHACLEARALGIALVLPGHYATERPAMIRLAGLLKAEFPAINAWASTVESDPVQWG